MTEQLKQPTTQTRPVGSDMTMDEILSSIRKIIATEDHLQSDNEDQQQSTSAQRAPQPQIKAPLSSQEQLKSLSQSTAADDFDPSSYAWSRNANDATHTRTPVGAASFEKQKQPFQNNTEAQNAKPDAAQQYHNNGDDASEILKTLEEIKKSLSAENLQKASHDCNETAEDETTIPSPASFTPVMKNSAKDTIVKKIETEDSNIHNNIDFKPAHFGQDDIPDFLKKFRKEQAETPAVIAPEGQSSYDFKEMQSFEDTDDAIIELTEALKDKEVVQQIAEKTSASLIAQNQDTKTTDRALDTTQPDDDDGMSDALEMLMIKSLRPMLKEWVEDNIAEIAQKVLREELQKKGHKK